MINEKMRIAGVPFVVTNLPQAVDWFLGEARRGSNVAVRLVNAYCIALSTQDADYRRVLEGDGVNFPDGASVVWGARLRLTSHLGWPQRVRGPSFFVECLSRSQGTGLSHFFLGSTEDTLTSLENEISLRFPEAQLSGFYSPPFGELNEEFYSTAQSKIEESAPDIVWLGLGTPKQDFAARRLSEALSLPCVGVGAAFDFLAGTVVEAPVWVQKSGFEWFFRLCSEPRRLWRRYLFGNARFLRELIRG